MINNLSLRLGTEDKGRTYRIFKSVLHTIRDVITLEESLKFSAKLSSFAKIVYEESWKERSPNNLTSPKTIQEFIDKVKENHSKMFLGHDFVNNSDIEKSCRMVFLQLKEWNHGITSGSVVIPDRICKLFYEKPQYNTIPVIDIINMKQISYN